MNCPKPLLIALSLSLVGCTNEADRQRAQVEALRDSLAFLSALEDRAFELFQLEDSTGRLVLVGSPQSLQAVEQEAREAVMVGCTTQARDALVDALESIARGAAEPWEKVERYRNAAEACESLLDEQDTRWPGKPG